MILKLASLITWGFLPPPSESDKGAAGGSTRLSSGIDLLRSQSLLLASRSNLNCPLSLNMKEAEASDCLACLGLFRMISIVPMTLLVLATSSDSSP